MKMNEKVTRVLSRALEAISHLEVDTQGADSALCVNEREESHSDSDHGDDEGKVEVKKNDDQKPGLNARSPSFGKTGPVLSTDPNKGVTVLSERELEDVVYKDR